jgi:hypothetical protein
MVGQAQDRHSGVRLLSVTLRTALLLLDPHAPS